MLKKSHDVKLRQQKLFAGLFLVSTFFSFINLFSFLDINIYPEYFLSLMVLTISSNLIGTTNILEALKVSNHKCTAIIITSDKAYENVEQVWGYKENDKMGGKDIYSGSKGAAELIIKSYYHSFFYACFRTWGSYSYD